MTPQISSRKLLALLLLLTLIVTFLPWIGDTLFNTKGEPREALVALSMVNSGNYILPESYGADIPYKPPFLAWLIVGCSWLTGGQITEFSSRLPSVIATILLIMGVYRYFMTRIGHNVAFATSVVTFTSVEVFRAATACRVDMVVTACIVTAVFALVGASDRRGGRPAFSPVAVILMTCGVLTKGPIGMLLPCLVAGCYMLMRRQRLVPVLGFMFLNGLASLIIPAIWYYLAWQEGGERFLNLAMEENFGRFTGKMSYDSHLNPWPYNLLTLIAGMAPYTLLAIMSLFSLRRLTAGSDNCLWRKPSKLWYRIMALQPATLLSLTASVVVFVFYCIPASKRSVYLLPMYPFLAYFTVMLAQRLIRVKAKSLGVYSIIIASVGLLTAWFVWGFHIVDAAGSTTGLKGAILDLATGLYNKPFGIADWSLIIISIIVCSLTLCVGSRRTERTKAVCALASTLTIYWVLGATVLPRTLNPKSDIVIARQIEKLDPQVDHTYTFNSVKMLRYFTAAFYLGDRLRMFAPEEGSSQSVGNSDATELPDEGYLIVGDREFDAWDERYGNMYNLDTVWTGSRRSADCRSIPYILRFKALRQ